MFDQGDEDGPSGGVLLQGAAPIRPRPSALFKLIDEGERVLGGGELDGGRGGPPGVLAGLGRGLRVRLEKGFAEPDEPAGDLEMIEAGAVFGDAVEFVPEILGGPVLGAAILGQPDQDAGHFGFDGFVERIDGKCRAECGERLAVCLAFTGELAGLDQEFLVGGEALDEAFEEQDAGLGVALEVEQPNQRNAGGFVGGVELCGGFERGFRRADEGRIARPSEGSGSVLLEVVEEGLTEPLAGERVAEHIPAMALVEMIDHGFPIPFQGERRHGGCLGDAHRARRCEVQFGPLLLGASSALKQFIHHEVRLIRIIGIHRGMKRDDEIGQHRREIDIGGRKTAFESVGEGGEGLEAIPLFQGGVGIQQGFCPSGRVAGRGQVERDPGGGRGGGTACGQIGCEGPCGARQRTGGGQVGETLAGGLEVHLKDAAGTPEKHPPMAEDRASRQGAQGVPRDVPVAFTGRGAGGANGGEFGGKAGGAWVVFGDHRGKGVRREEVDCGIPGCADCGIRVRFQQSVGLQDGFPTCGGGGGTLGG